MTTESQGKEQPAGYLGVIGEDGIKPANNDGLAMPVDADVVRQAELAATLANIPENMAGFVTEELLGQKGSLTADIRAKSRRPVIEALTKERSLPVPFRPPDSRVRAHKADIRQTTSETSDEAKSERKRKLIKVGAYIGAAALATVGVVFGLEGSTLLHHGSQVLAAGHHHKDVVSHICQK